MKSRTLLYFYIVLLLNLSITSAQTLKVVDVIKKRIIVIKTIGKDTRNVVPVLLPKNTVEWYYSFTTDTEALGTKTLNLAVQLGGLVASAYYGKAAGSILSQIEVPEGSSRVDIYLMNNNGKERFIIKDDIKWGARGISRYESGSVTSTKSGTVKIKSPNSGTLYLGLKHPGGYNSFNVILEVVAIVKSY